ncbi:helix-turn-helix domain-containing protein [Agromyces aerolatus]|uniref:helix-turn-helix domain-containing protein n=1 Tax=Agromyces sp. LY-1074 TaxID=3074080 RepID=UPI0028660B91|nr:MULTISPECIES: helix-turn-helix domain-containing protein [unclassified Agromyces]MDR5701840.1 helix-turn-helix domain-containing protein [Agromyces sp. LY-1074]MDR5708087.1 helix-turn-helix domain-containing protein [Agromyces sp. LY-1358]
MPRATAAAAAETARIVLATATDLFGASGYAEVSLEDVAAAAGVTRGAVYHHYGTKLGLFRAVAAGLQAEVADAVAAAADAAGAHRATDASARSDLSGGADVSGRADASGGLAAMSLAFEELRAGSHAFLDAITAAPVARVLLVDAPAVIGWTEWRELDAANSARHLREALASVGAPEDLLDALTAQLSGAMNEAALRLAAHPADAPARAAAHRTLDRLLEAAIA